MYLEKDKKRLLNRNKKQLLKARAKKILKERFFDEDFLTQSHIGIFATTPKNCSCKECGNARRHYKHVTLKEKILLDKCHPDNVKYWKV